MYVRVIVLPNNGLYKFCSINVKVYIYYNLSKLMVGMIIAHCLLYLFEY